MIHYYPRIHHVLIVTTIVTKGQLVSISEESGSFGINVHLAK
jgi:hypothetical protein